ncbi:MAG: CPBP family intramembrane metalloprotease [Arenicella sp.]|nr:CPBP family intramembrane metalloprotease [Arenicella sp.]
MSSVNQPKKSFLNSAAWTRFSIFYALTFLLLIVIPVVHSLIADGPMDFDAAGARASATTGLAWTSNLWVVFRLCLAEPVLALVVFGSAVPSIAGLLVCIGRNGRVRELFSRFRVRIPWRVALKEYGLIFLVMVVGLSCTYALRSALSGPEYERPAEFLRPGLVLALLAAAFLDQGAVLEELGWRGYALSELQEGLMNPLAAAVVIGVAWGLWHVPRDVTWGVVERLGLLQYLLLYLPSFLAGTITVSIIITYFVNRCGGSILPAIMIHGLNNDAVGFAGFAPLEIILSPMHQITSALPFAVIAFVIVIKNGRQLGLNKHTTI